MDEGCVVTMAERDGVLAPNACFFFFVRYNQKETWRGARRESSGGWEGEIREVSGCLECKHESISSSGEGRLRSTDPRSRRTQKGRRRPRPTPGPRRSSEAPRAAGQRWAPQPVPNVSPGPSGLLDDRSAVGGTQRSSQAWGWDRTRRGWHETALGLQTPFNSSLSLVQISRSSLGLRWEGCSGRARPSCVACDRALYCRRANKRSEHGSIWRPELLRPLRSGPALLGPALTRPGAAGSLSGALRAWAGGCCASIVLHRHPDPYPSMGLPRPAMQPALPGVHPAIGCG